jgi:hypothetical protein
MVGVLTYPDAWLGTDEQVMEAIGNINKFLSLGFEDCDMGITDIRYQATLDPAERLQFLLNGEWVNVTDWPILEAKFDDIDELLGIHQVAIDNAESAILGLFDSQDVQDTRLDAIEAEQIVQNDRLDTLESDIIVVADAADFALSTADEAMDFAVSADAAAAVADAKAVAAQGDIDAVSVDFYDLLTEWELQDFWTKEFNFLADADGWSGAAHVASSGLQITTSDLAITYSGVTVRDSRILAVRVQIAANTAGAQARLCQFPVGGSDSGALHVPASGSTYNVLQVNNSLAPYTPSFGIQGLTSGTAYLVSLRIWGQGDPVW